MPQFRWLVRRGEPVCVCVCVCVSVSVFVSVSVCSAWWSLLWGTSSCAALVCSGEVWVCRSSGGKGAGDEGYVEMIVINNTGSSLKMLDSVSADPVAAVDLSSSSHSQPLSRPGLRAFRAQTLRLLAAAVRRVGRGAEAGGAGR